MGDGGRQIWKTPASWRCFFFPVWCLLVVLGLLIGRKAGRRVTGGKRVAQRKA